MQEHQYEHKQVMAQEEHEMLCSQLELQRLMVQEQALKWGHSGEDDIMEQ